MGKFKCKCIVPGCAHYFLVEARTIEKAVEKILIEGSVITLITIQIYPS